MLMITSMPGIFKSLSFFDRYLAIFILLAMITGVLIGVYAPKQVERAFGGAEWQGVSVRKSAFSHSSLEIQKQLFALNLAAHHLIAILVGLIIMMWPVLTKVQYEVLPLLFRSRRLWVHIIISCFLNWILAPFIMLAVGMNALNRWRVAKCDDLLVMRLQPGRRYLRLP